MNYLQQIIVRFHVSLARQFMHATNMRNIDHKLLNNWKKKTSIRENQLKSAKSVCSWLRRGSNDIVVDTLF